MAADEVRRGPFVYRDTLFAETGGDKRHTRASIADLRDLLLPRRVHLTSQDKTGHWYEAQLLHYGLPRTRDKNTAKVRLTSALTSDNLVVPQHILQMEAEMKKEYLAAYRRAKAAANNVIGSISPNKRNLQGTKRKTDTSETRQSRSSRTTISIKTGGLTVDIDHQQSTTNNTKRQKLTPIKRNSTDRPPTRPYAKKQTAKRHAPPGTPPIYNYHAYPSRLNSSNNDDANVDDDDDDNNDDEAPPSYDSHNFNNHHHHNPINIEDYNDNHPPSPTPIQISGTYHLTTHPTSPHSTLTLTEDTTTNQIWGHFNTHNQSGILHTTNPPDLTSQERVRFVWRARNLETGELRFRRDQDGWIVFDGEGGVVGCWNGLVCGYDYDYNCDGDVEFEGWLEGGSESGFGVGAGELRKEWEGFVRWAYGRY